MAHNCDCEGCRRKWTVGSPAETCNGDRRVRRWNGKGSAERSEIRWLSLVFFWGIAICDGRGASFGRVRIKQVLLCSSGSETLRSSSSICREGSQSDNQIPAASLHCLSAVRSEIFLRSDTMVSLDFGYTWSNWACSGDAEYGVEWYWIKVYLLDD